MFYLLLLVTFIAGLVVVTSVGAISSTVYFLLNYPPVLAIVVIAFCLIAPSDDGHACEQRDKYGRLVPCYPAPGSLPNSERMGRMCRAAERRLWRDVLYFANMYTRAARPGVAVMCTLLREVYKCLREVCRCLREGVICLAPIVMSAAALVVKAFCVSSTARRVMISLISICALAYLLASVVAGLLLDERNTPGMGCVLSYFAQFMIVVGLFHRPLWQYAETTGTVSRVLASIRAEMDEYDASPDGSMRRGKRARTCAQPQVKQKESRTSARSSQSSSPAKYPTQRSKTDSSDPSSSRSSIAQSSTPTSRSNRVENGMASSPATSVGSVEGKKYTKTELKPVPAAILRADGATKEQSSKSKVLDQNVQSKRDQVAGASESARGAMASHIPKLTSKESIPVGAGNNTAPTLASVTNPKGQVEAEMEKSKSKAENGTPAELTSAEIASKADTHVVKATREKVAGSEKTDLSKAKAIVASTPEATPVGTTSSTSPSTLPPKATSELHPSLFTADLNTCDNAPVSPSSVQTPTDPKSTEQSIRPGQTSHAIPLVLKSLPHAASVQAIRIYAPAPYPRANVSVLATRAARAELKKKQAAKKAKKARPPMRLAAKPSAAPVYAGKPDEPSAASTAQSESVDVPEMPVTVAPAASDPETDVRQRSSTASCETIRIVCEVNGGTTSANQSMSPPRASPEEASTAAQPAIQPVLSPVVPAPQKVAASRAPPSIRRGPVDGASFFKPCKPTSRPAPSTSSTKSSGSDAKQARAPQAPAIDTSASTAGPSVNHIPMKKELLAAYKETFGAKQSSTGTEADLDLGLAAAPAAPGACRQLGRVEAKKTVAPKKNVRYTTDAQGKQQVTAGEVKKEEYVYKWSLDLGMPGVKMRAPKELWEGN